ncbi:hypothetical protein J057_22940 [Marinobacter nanhaiticus D15-8W]|uniref:Uncharacterized protein n=1 Tax=Marinobacter nanhaiticus D15-8W TaxID=626887 RepID=N6VVU0_9GAMM|nr:hypothetical protein J057_22940 [Marinobacter nanhaiticus D15-8W]
MTVFLADQLAGVWCDDRRLEREAAKRLNVEALSFELKLYDIFVTSTLSIGSHYVNMVHLELITKRNKEVFMYDESLFGGSYNILDVLQNYEL